MIHNFLLIVLGVLSVMSLLCLLRLVLGPTAADRLLAVNMLGGMVISAIAVLSLLHLCPDQFPGCSGDGADLHWGIPHAVPATGRQRCRG